MNEHKKSEPEKQKGKDHPHTCSLTGFCFCGRIRPCPTHGS